MLTTCVQGFQTCFGPHLRATLLPSNAKIKELDETIQATVRTTFHVWLIAGFSYLNPGTFCAALFMGCVDYCSKNQPLAHQVQRVSALWQDTCPFLKFGVAAIVVYASIVMPIATPWMTIVTGVASTLCGLHCGSVLMRHLKKDNLPPV